MPQLVGWRRIISRIRFIRCYYLTELRRVRLNRRIITLGREFWAHSISYENGFLTVVYEERHT